MISGYTLPAFRKTSQAVGGSCRADWQRWRCIPRHLQAVHDAPA